MTANSNECRTVQRVRLGWIRLLWSGALATTIACALSSAADASVVRTTYQYNADGALTATTASVNGQPPVTTYYSWGNFVPNAGDPRTGTVHAANSHLAGYGPSPSVATATFSYDLRDRLVGCANDAKPTVTHGYDASSMLASSTLASGDVQRLYYGSTPHLSNQRQTSGGQATSYFGPLRYTSDGGEQLLLGPRKDTAALYMPAAELLSTYGYESFGAPRATPDAHEGLTPDGSRFDLAHNPMQYAGEYRDSICEAYNLRARWYLPQAKTFLTRDPIDSVQRFGYTGGNPVNRSDPSGMSYRSFQRAIGKMMNKLTPIGVTTLSALPWIGPAMFVLQTAAAGAFWHDRKQAMMFGYQALAAGVGAILEVPALDRLAGYRAAFALRNAANVGIGAGQSVLAASGKHHRFDQGAFWSNMGATAGSMLVGRVAAGVGYRPYSLADRDVQEMVVSHARDNPRSGKVLVFRARSKVGRLPVFTSPLLEEVHLGAYHEATLAAEPSTSNFRYTVAQVGFHPGTGDDTPIFHVQAERWREVKPNLRYQFVGAFDRQPGLDGLYSNPLGMTTLSKEGTQTYDVLRRNCQHSAAAVINQIQARQSTYQSRAAAPERGSISEIDDDLFFD